MHFTFKSFTGVSVDSEMRLDNTFYRAVDSIWIESNLKSYS